MLEKIRQTAASAYKLFSSLMIPVSLVSTPTHARIVARVARNAFLLMPCSRASCLSCVDTAPGSSVRRHFYGFFPRNGAHVQYTLKTSPFQGFASHSSRIAALSG